MFPTDLGPLPSEELLATDGAFWLPALLLPLRLPGEWSLLDIYLTLAFFLACYIYVWICLILVKFFLSLFLEVAVFRFRF